MKRLLTTMTLAAAALCAVAETKTVASPDGRLQVCVDIDGGRAAYAVSYDGRQVVLPSALGLKANVGDFSAGLTLKGAAESSIDETYQMRGTKASQKRYVARRLTLNLENAKGQPMDIEMQVADNDVAFRYVFPQRGETACMVIDSELTSFRFPEQTTTFICPQSDPMIGWMRTKPSYEEEYKPDAPMTARSQYGRGYTFPCLFHVGEDGWVLVSETGAAGAYPGTHLSDYDPATGYQIAFPMAEEANGFGTPDAGLALPGATPWRTLTVGASLKPIVETTVAYDVVKPLYEPSRQYEPGRYTWSWLIWQDKSINYDDQVKFVDLAAEMGYEYCLVDNWWDRQIGRERMAELSKYAQQKGVRLLLWYNSNGYENDAPQTPKQCMNTSLARRQEMAWLKQIGVAGIKVDFFAGDKQHTMQLYEDILVDANDFGLQVVFHGCTLPRGWERLYPNFVASEAVLASENVFFTDYHASQEPFQLTVHPFCRNAVAAMDWGGVIMNKYLSRDNRSRHQRHTTDVFEMATGITNQSSVNCVALQPNNLQELPQMELDFLRELPTTWDETRFIDGYPGRYVVLARRHGARWYVAGLNAEPAAKKLTLQLPAELAGQPLSYYVDTPKGPQLQQLRVDKRAQAKVVIQPNGGVILR